MGVFDGVPYTVKSIITERMIVAAGVSPLGALVPIVDMGAITVIWGNMLYEIAKYHNVSFTVEECTKIITSCGGSIFGYLGGSKALNWLLNLIPGVGTLGAMAGNVMFNGYYTYAVGIAFHKMLAEYDIGDKTIKEIAKILIHIFVPIPSRGDLKEIYTLIKEHLI